MNGIICKLCRADFLTGRLLWPMLAFVLMTGCWGIVVPIEEGDEPFREETLESLLGSTREEIQQKLGPHHVQLEGEEKTYFIYQGWVDSAGVVSPGLPVPVWWAESRICSLLVFGSEKRLDSYETTTWGYDISLVEMSEYEQAKPHWNCKHAFFTENELGTLRKVTPVRYDFYARAVQGDPEGMYQYANSLRRREDKFKWYCLAARQGHAMARFELGRYHQYGLVQFEDNYERAYFWYTLAIEADHASAEYYRTEFSREMTLTQIADAERLVAEWEPNPEECEVYSDAANAP